MRAFHLILCLLLGFFFRLPVLGQSYYFKHYQVENGLSNNSVVCMLQDKRGFMWFGTKDGLNRFDGYTFKSFRRQAGNRRSIGNNFIHVLYEDKQGTLLIGTDKGLYQYEEKTEEFRLLSLTAGISIDRITEDNNGNIWFTSRLDVCRYERRTGKLECYDPARFFYATALCTTTDGTLVAGTPDGQLQRYHPETNTFTGFDLFAHSKPTSSRWIESLYLVKDGRLIAGTSNTEIKIIDPSLSRYEDITIACSEKTNLYIRSIQQTAPDEFWLGTETGIFVYNIKNGECRHLQKNPNNPYAVSDNAVYALCRDREGGLWAGTYFGGINYFPAQFTPFERFFPGTGENPLSGNVVREMVQDRYGNLWIGTEDACLNKLELLTGYVQHFRADGKPGSISFFNIHGLLVSGDELWIGTFNHGVDVMDVRRGKVVRHYEAGTASGLPHNFIYCFYQTDNGQIFVGTPGGISSYNREKDIFEPFRVFPSSVWYTAVLKDMRGRLWGGTFGYGLNMYNPATGKTENFIHQEKDPFSFSNDRVNTIFEDSHQNIWFGTEEGLCRWNEGAHNFTRFGTVNGFPSDFILSILEDKEQNLWISTTKGLVRFHPASGKTEVFTTTNGLLSDQFNYNSAFKDADGRMYFGSAKGLIRFNPDQFRKSSFVPPIYITNFLVNGKEVNAKNAGSPLQQSISFTNSLTLPHNQSTFSIDFAALSFTEPEKLLYTYQMEGLSSAWMALGSNRRVDFIGLPPGTYTFKVRARDGTWSQAAKLQIVILPPWWKSKWAYTAYIIATLLLLFFVVRFFHRRMAEKNKRRIERLKMENEKEMLKLELAKEKELAEAKIEFFTNVAHEIRTPLTLIKAPLQRVIKKASVIPDLKNSLSIMERNTNRLIEITNQLLDFRQAEINNFHLSFEKTDVAELIKDTCSDFRTLAEQNNISLSLHMQYQSFFAAVDVDAFHKIIYNLLSNSVKYAKRNVEIELTTPESSSVFTLWVKSDGYLIPEKWNEKIFEPFVRLPQTESQTGTGIGLALSRSLAQLHGGTLTLQPPQNNMNVFALTLPTHQGNGMQDGNTH